MKKSIFFKTFIISCLIILIASVFIGIFSFNIIKRYYVNALYNNLKDFGISLTSKIIPIIETRNFKELDNFLKQLGAQVQTRITLINRSGIVLADSEGEPRVMKNQALEPEVMQAMEGIVGRSLRFDTIAKEEVLYIAIPLMKENVSFGVLRMSLFLKDMNMLLNDLKVNIIVITIVGITILFFVSYFFSRGMSNSLKELIKASHKIASGDFNVWVSLKNKNELKELAESFNYMADRMKTLFEDLSRQKQELNSIISSIQEGLLVLDRDGKILLSNESFKNIIQNNSINGKPYWGIIRNPNFNELIKKVKNGKKNFSSEIELLDKLFLCSATFLEPREEIVLVFHDITEMKKLEKIKRDLAANVSHELRTPLSAIKGFVETLQEEITDKNKQHYLNIIKRHTDRVIKIVNDLLVLSKLEEKGLQSELENVNFGKLIEDVCKMFEHQLVEKNLQLKIDIEKGLPDIKGDIFKLEQMLINLIDNAIKYTEKGEISIVLKQKEKQVIIEIQDTGIGIAKEHLSRIFERFYVVDKSRSRKLGGTGLGLSIVKHIVLLHNGRIDVESTLGKGTKFTITLPINPILSNP